MLIGNLSVFVIGSYYIAVFLFGITQFNVLGLNSSFTDIVTLFWIFIILVTKNYLKINFKSIKLELSILLFFIIYAGLETLNGMYGHKSLSLYLQLVRSFLIFILVLHFMKNINILSLNRFIFKFGFLMSILMIIMYGLFLTTGYLPISIFEYGESQSIRFEGFAGDANFYAFLMSVSFLIGYYSSWQELNVKVKALYLLPIGINIVMTISRSVIMSLIVSFIFVSFAFEKKISKQLTKLYWFFIIFIFFVLLSMIELPIINISLYDWYSMRSTQNSPRFGYWMILYEYFLQQPILGYGLRASEVLLGGYGNYAHSSYVELFIDYGIVGSIIFLFFMFLVFIKGLKILKLNTSYKPWIHSYIIICMLFSGFTLLYWSFFWTIVAIILGGYIYEKNRFNNNLIQ